ncbi:MAG: hypothetical protein ACI9FJ_002527 [Alteromonadaceae bacterium]|jgi:hypothetical protein
MLPEGWEERTIADTLIRVANPVTVEPTKTYR